MLSINISTTLNHHQPPLTTLNPHQSHHYQKHYHPDLHCKAVKEYGQWPTCLDHDAARGFPPMIGVNCSTLIIDNHWQARVLIDNTVTPQGVHLIEIVVDGYGFTIHQWPTHERMDGVLVGKQIGRSTMIGCGDISP